MCNCLYCYRPLSGNEKDFHPACAKKFFKTTNIPTIDYTLDQIDALAAQIIEKQTTLTGVQPKLSLHLSNHEENHKLAIVGLWGGYIMKPQTKTYAQLPEVEDLTMHLAEIAKIDIVPHTPMRMADGSLCYLTKRVDLTEKGDKIPMEDLCQLTERPTEHKYKSSYEMIGKTILRYSSLPKMDLTNFLEVLLFSWIVGNNNMHLKNFSLYEPIEGKPRLTPAYDLLNAAIVNPRDTEELALTLNGRKSKIKPTDFVTAATTLGLPNNVMPNLFNKYISLESKFVECIQISFLNEELKSAYCKLIQNRLNRIKE